MTGVPAGQEPGQERSQQLREARGQQPGQERGQQLGQADGQLLGQQGGQAGGQPVVINELATGMPVLYGGNRVTHVSEDLAAAFKPGDRLIVVQATGALLHIPSGAQTLVDDAVTAATEAFAVVRGISSAAIRGFYESAAARLRDDQVFARVGAANEQDVVRARALGRSTTRLVLSPKMRSDMIAGLDAWRLGPDERDAVTDELAHQGWRVEQRRAPLGVVGFVFEGRPNVFADATGVLRSGNTVVLRIGSDALGTAQAMMAQVLQPALADSGLPEGSVVLLNSPSRATGWALFSDPRVALAVARGSGPAVAELGAVARQSGVPVSLHGTGGAWIVSGDSVDADRFALAVRHSLDRKVCNSLNVCAIQARHAEALVPRFLAALDAAAAARGVEPKLHVVEGAERFVPDAWFDTQVVIQRAEGKRNEARAETLALGDVGVEWEWEESPEVTLLVVDSTKHAIELFNRYSPRLVASLISDDPAEHERFWHAIDAPFVGDGFTRWVDGQFALGKPELGLSNWQHGRFLARSAVLSGDSVFTIRTRAYQTDPDLHR